MFLILDYGEYDSQSSKEAWDVCWPYRKGGFATRKEAEAQIAQKGADGGKYYIAEVTEAIIPKVRTTVGLRTGAISAEKGA